MMKKTESHKDTIFALASGKGRAGISVIRISGTATHDVVVRIFKKTIIARITKYGDFIDPDTNKLIDRGMVIWFPAPHSFTGEDVAELHVHGSHAVLDKLLSTLSKFKGVRLAEPGEFTRRAFEHGKLDLVQAEGLNDLIVSQTDAQRQQALYQLGGGLSDIYLTWREQLTACLADIEATIDFSEEEIPVGLLERVSLGVKKLTDEISSQLDDGGRGEAIRSGYRIAILGPPNVGKSSLLNALAKEERAIVSDIAGTTRDIVELQINLAGYAVLFADTAGLREAKDSIEQEGVIRAQKQAETANLKLVLIETTQWPDIPPETQKLINGEVILVLSKADLAQDLCGPKDAFAISTKTGEGLEDLIQEIEKRVISALEKSEPPGITRTRHREALKNCHQALNRFLTHDIQKSDPAILAEDLRLASRNLGSITGQTSVEDILEHIFSQFCIGK